jgi:diguanylate cyclase (GGDEF)-like protein
VALHWSTHQLTEYLAAVGAPESEPDAVMVGVERMIESLDSEVGVVLLDGEVACLLGVGADDLALLQGALAQRAAEVELPLLGRLHLLSSSLGREVAGQVIVARECAPFDAEERQMLEGMARVLGLTVRGLRTLAAERELVWTLQQRELLLETMLEIQRAISSRVPLQEVLDRITHGAAALLGATQVGLGRPEPQGFAEVSRFESPDSEAWDLGPAVAAAVDADEAAIVEHDGGNEVAIAVPVHVSGGIDCCLVAAVPSQAATLDEQRNLLVAFAQQVSLALADARAVEAMYAASHDALTGLANRALFAERLELELGRSEQGGDERVSVLFIDLDGFKGVNDSLGHAAGDELLIGVAGRLQGCVRSSSIVARLGGDEFAVLLDDLGEPGARQVAERIASSLEAPFAIGAREMRISASVGVAARRGETRHAAELIADADVAMYSAKKSGGGRVACFEPSMRWDDAGSAEPSAA